MSNAEFETLVADIPACECGCIDVDVVQEALFTVTREEKKDKLEIKEVLSDGEYYEPSYIFKCPECGENLEA